MVEPEIMMDGNHTIERCYSVTAEVLQTLFAEMAEQGIYMGGAILKVSMVLPGKDCPVQVDTNAIAEMTVKCLKENVPADLAGVVFLSGGQSSEESTIRLDAMNKIGGMPWPLSFSYGRAIQKPALNAWAQNRADVLVAQKLLVEQARKNSEASLGKYVD